MAVCLLPWTGLVTHPFSRSRARCLFGSEPNDLTSASRPRLRIEAQLLRIQSRSTLYKTSLASLGSVDFRNFRCPANWRIESLSDESEECIA